MGYLKASNISRDIRYLGWSGVFVQCEMRAHKRFNNIFCKFSIKQKLLLNTDSVLKCINVAVTSKQSKYIF